MKFEHVMIGTGLAFFGLIILVTVLLVLTDDQTKYNKPLRNPLITDTLVWEVHQPTGLCFTLLPSPIRPSTRLMKIEWVHAVSVIDCNKTAGLQKSESEITKQMVFEQEERSGLCFGVLNQRIDLPHNNTFSGDVFRSQTEVACEKVGHVLINKLPNR